MRGAVRRMTAIKPFTVEVRAFREHIEELASMTPDLIYAIVRQFESDDVLIRKQIAKVGKVLTSVKNLA